tara:strand:- start:11122 stop:11505 length:384 start_codon:yes stop_codon:yes gene_type:complete
MAKKKIMVKGIPEEELKKYSIEQFIGIANARARRSLKRGFTPLQKQFLNKINKGAKNIKTHCTDIIIIPKMIDMTIRVYNGKEFIPVTIQSEMVGHYLGEFVQTRKKVSHSAPGIGATRSSASVSVR